MNTPLIQPALKTAAAVLASSAILLGPVSPALASTSHTSDRPHAGHHHRQQVIPFTSATVQKARGANRWTVSWSSERTQLVRVYVGDEAGEESRRATGLTVGRHGTLTFTSRADRPWVKLVPAYGQPLEVTARVLGLESAPNLRDAGGYRTTDGRWVKYGAVYRSPALALTDEDAATVGGLGISDDYDLRTTDEAATEPDVQIPGMAYHHLDVLGSLGNPGTGGSQLPDIATAQEARTYMAQAELAMVDSESAKSAYHDLFTGLANAEGAGLYHCTAGKDRTGWANAVLLTLLGVDEATVTEDYLLSNTYFFESPAIQAQLAAMPAAQREIYEPFMRVEEEYLRSGLDRVAEEYGSMEAYAVDGLGLSPRTLAKLRARLLVGEPTRG
ncbi:tyrosine-protein phosphatase [Nocardioides insulae]|uniref:tyrosine-protein phosphatase n=1 Tax=Nocardioides insulae TaxID=394734 RepID=UPI000425EEA9|nr:tyrosine-protein phosphatase [Nocardioides insulae]